MLLRSVGLHGVFIGAHAVAEGFLTRHQLQQGPYVRVLQGVYADPSLPRDHLLRCRAAALLMPETAALGGRSAATLLGGPAPGYTDRVTVIVPDDVFWTGPHGIRTHRSALPADQVVHTDELRRTNAIRTAWDVAVLEPVGTAVGVLDALLRADAITEPELQRCVRTGAGRWGSRRVRRAVELIDRRAGSPPESWVRVACALGGLPAPVPQYVVRAGGVVLGRVDLAWPDARLIVEYEGEYHFDELQIRKDDRRYARLVAAGWRVIRLAAHDLRDLPSVVTRIEDALRQPQPVG